MSDSDTDDDVYGEQADEAWEEWDGAEDEEDDAAKSLFSDTVLPNPEAAFDYDAQHFGFDIRQYRIEVSKVTLRSRSMFQLCDRVGGGGGKLLLDVYRYFQEKPTQICCPPHQQHRVWV